MNAGMVFGLIFTIIVIALVLIFGLGQMGNMFCMSSDAQAGKAMADLETVASEVYNLAEGSSRSFRVILPGDAKLCFVDPENPGTQLYTAADSWKNWVPDPVYEGIIREKGYNLWYEICSGKGGKAIGSLRVPKSFCVTGGKTVYLENKGLWVEISV